jgi:hypothetical protein
MFNTDKHKNGSLPGIGLTEIVIDLKISKAFRSARPISLHHWNQEFNENL